MKMSQTYNPPRRHRVQTRGFTGPDRTKCHDICDSRSGHYTNHCFTFYFGYVVIPILCRSEVEFHPLGEDCDSLMLLRRPIVYPLLLMEVFCHTRSHGFFCPSYWGFSHVVLLSLFFYHIICN